MATSPCLPPAHYDTANRDVIVFEQAIEMYRVSLRGACPLDLQTQREAGLIGLVSADPWGHPYRWQCGSDFSIRVISAGPDGRFGSDDDTTNGGEVLEPR